MLSSPQPQIDAQNTLVKCDRVALRYGRGPETLKGVDFTLKTGAFCFLTGASGAGKSTLLKMLSLNLKPTRGLISLFGNSTEALPLKARQVLKRRIGLVSQDFDLISHFNVFENTALPLRAAGQLQTSYQNDVIDLLRWVGLGDRLTALPRTLSGGERQRVAIARAVISKPDFLIADEPTGNVDPVMGQRLLRLFTEMNRGGTTVLIATHDTGLLGSIHADRLHIENGLVEYRSAR